MRKIRVKNLTPEILVHIIVAAKSYSCFFIEKKLYEKMILEATEMNERLHFTTTYGDFTIVTAVKCIPFCDQYYKIDCVSLNDVLLYAYSQYRTGEEQICIDAE